MCKIVVEISQVSQMSQESTCAGAFFNKVEKRLLWNLRNFENTLFSRGCFWQFQVSSLQLYWKRNSDKLVFFCEFCKVFKYIFWQNISGWLLLVFICEFWEVFQNTCFYRAPQRNCLFHVQPADTVTNYFTAAFQVFNIRTRSSHSKAFSYLRSLKITLEEVNS